MKTETDLNKNMPGEPTRRDLLAGAAAVGRH